MNLISRSTSGKREHFGQMDILPVVLGKAQAMTQFKSTSRTKVKGSHSFLNKKIDKQQALKKLSKIISKDYNEIILKNISQRTAEYLYDRKENFIFVDLSILAINDAGTGIQRVCKNILNFLPNLSKYNVIPIHSQQNEFEKYGFRYCSKWDENKKQENEETIEFIPGDILFFPELSADNSISQKDYLKFLHKKRLK